MKKGCGMSNKIIKINKKHSLIEVDPKNQIHTIFLYHMLANRDPKTNISHKIKPPFENHVDFIKNNPYYKWWLICDEEKIIGNTYLTTRKNLSGHAIGIFFSKKNCGKGVGTKVIKKIISLFPGERFLANISPKNHQSRIFFKKLGFKLIQNTYEFIGE